MGNLKKRQKDILEKIYELRNATGRELAAALNLSVNGIMQTLNRLALKTFTLKDGHKYQLRPREKETGRDPDRVIWYLRLED